MARLASLPVDPNWTLVPATQFPALGAAVNSVLCTSTQLVQRVDGTYAAATLLTGAPPAILRGTTSFLLPEELDIDAIWPTHTTAKVDMEHAAVPTLYSQYMETLFGTQPLFFFPKQALGRARMSLDKEAYRTALWDLLESPEQLDKRYIKDVYMDDTPLRQKEDVLADSISKEDNFIRRVKLASGDRSVHSVLDSLRARETQLQVMLALELAEKDQLAAHLLDRHFDRLCIWQAVGSQPSVNDFCSTVIVPYFLGRAPRRTRHLVRASRGLTASKHRERNPPKKVTLRRVPALLRALQQNSINLEENSSEPPQQPSNTKAARSISHPVYRQPTVEVRFRPSRSRTVRSNTPITSPTIPESIPESLPESIPESIPENTVEFAPATPVKDRKKYLMTHIDDDEEIGSTDSD